MGDITDDAVSLSDVYKLLRAYYQFAPLESTFIKFSSMKREDIDGVLERLLHLYLRMMQFIRDNLLLSSGRIKHDGSIPQADEKLSPTSERLIVLRWLEILHPQLPNHVATVFAHELQGFSLKDLQPRIANQIYDLLSQLESKSNEIDAQFSRFSTRNDRFSKSSKNFNHSSREYGYRDNPPKRGYTVTKPYGGLFKKCEACKTVGEPFIGHEVRDCPNIRIGDRANLLKSFNLDIDGESDNSPEDNEIESKYTDIVLNESSETETINVERVNIVESPQFNVKINSTMITMVLDTGATGSMISLELCELANLKVYPSTHSAILADGDSKLKVVGEVHTSIIMDGYLKLPISAVVVTRLKA